MSAIYFSFVWIFTVVAMSSGSSSPREIPSAVDYFGDQISGDVSRIKWAHAVNSRELLMNALQADEIMMLEADILLGKKDGGNTLIPIMAHPPNKTSDLSFDDFLAAVIKAVKDKKVKKGIKLDFKDINAVKLVLKSLKNIDFPVWLNADILQGPIDSQKTPINATEFLTRCKNKFPQGTLSVGWTTRYCWDDAKQINRSIPAIEGEGYTMAHAEEMLRTLEENKIDLSATPVTFPLRAGLLPANSTEFIDHLLQNEKSSITLWSAVDDKVDMVNLRKVVASIPKAQCYIDLPFSLEDGPKDSSRPANCDTHPDAEEVHNHHSEEVDGAKVHGHDNDGNHTSSSHLTTASSTFLALIFVGFAVTLI